MVAQSIPTLLDRGHAPDPSEQRPAAIAPTPSASERRLRLVVESAPVSLCILDPESKVLAANRAALTLLGVERLHEVVGTSLDRLVMPEGRERFMAFVANVCRGEAGTLQYELTAPGGTSRSVETHAVPLRREASATASFLGVTWDVSDKTHAATALQQLQQQWEEREAQRSAEREAWEEALRRARETHDEMSTSRQRVQATLSDLTAQWTAERDALRGKLTDAEARCETLAAQRLIEQNGQRTSLEEAERNYQAALAARVEAERQLAQTLEERTTERTVLEGLLARLIAFEHAQREYEGSLATRSAENEQLKQAMHEERTSFGERLAEARTECEGLTDQLQNLQRHTAAVAERWHRELAEAVCPLQEASARIERLLNEGRNAPAASADGWQETEEKPAQPLSVSADASADVEPDEEASWRF